MSTASKIWNRLNEGVLGYVFYIFLGVAAALIVTNLLGVALDTSIPLVAVVSGSMDHAINIDGTPCGTQTSGYKESFDNWWTMCEHTYTGFGIDKAAFSGFPFRDGLKRGDIAVLQNGDGPAVGDIIVYNIPSQSVPIIHRVVQTNADSTLQTKGDHNPGQNPYEPSIQESQVRGKVIFVIPYLGYLRVLLPIN